MTSYPNADQRTVCYLPGMQRSGRELSQRTGIKRRKTWASRRWSFASILVIGGRYVAISLIVLMAFILLFQRFLAAIIPLNPTQLLGLSVAALATLLVDFSRTLNQRGSSSGIAIEHLPLAEALQQSFQRNRNVRTLRVLAATSEGILPIVRDSHAHILECRLLVQDFRGKRDSKSRAMFGKIQGIVSSWADVVSMGLIEQLEVRAYGSVPVVYSVILDESCAVFGLYYPAERVANVVDFLDPIFLDANSDSGKLAVEKLIRQFDLIFEGSTAWLLTGEGRR
jgi:hypothetical protein